MSSLALPNPVKVSPLIKLARWSLFIYGLYYGVARRSYLKKKETQRRIDEIPIKKEVEFRKKVASGENNRSVAIDFARDFKEFGITLPPEYYKPCYGKSCKEVYDK